MFVLIFPIVASLYTVEYQEKRSARIANSYRDEEKDYGGVSVDRHIGPIYVQPEGESKRIVEIYITRFDCGFDVCFEVRLD